MTQQIYHIILTITIAKTMIINYFFNRQTAFFKGQNDSFEGQSAFTLPNVRYSIGILERREWKNLEEKFPYLCNCSLTEASPMGGNEGKEPII